MDSRSSLLSKGVLGKADRWTARLGNRRHGGKASTHRVVERSPFRVHDHEPSCTRDAVSKFCDFGDIFGVGTVGTGTEDGTKNASARSICPS